VRLTERIKPISYVKANAAEIVGELGSGGEPLIITVNGEAKAVLQDLAAYERQQEALALLKLLALSQREVDADRVDDAEEVFDGVLRELG
jgi:prevent-host-death family protein